MKKNKSTVALAVAIFFVAAVFGFNFQKDAFTNYYYYEGEPYHLVHVPDAIFVEISEEVDDVTFNSLMSQFPVLYLKENFSFTYKKDFVYINASLSDEEFKDLITNLNKRAEIVNAAPVFKMPEGEGNPNTLIGVEKEVIAQFKPQLSESEITLNLIQRGMAIVQELSLSGGKSYVLSIPQGKYAIDYANELHKSGLVNYAEPNLFFTNLLQVTDPNDPFFPMQWSHRNLGNNIPGGVSGTVGCDMRTDSAWTISMGDPSVIVSIVDTGIDTLHEDLHERMIVGLSINTYSNLPYAWDDNNHGTACAGIVAATGNNNLGVIGVAPLSRIFGVKIFNSAGSTNSTAIINGLIAAWQRGSWVSSNSWGGGSPITGANNAIQDGVNMGRNGKGVVWSFATGNSNGSSISWPSSNPNVIAVGGISPCNQRKSTSSCDGETWWGAQYGTGLTIVAPCVKVYTTDRTGSPGYSSGNYFSQFNGTSSATPNLSGVAALMLAVDSTLTWNIVREIIALTAEKVGAYTYNQAGYLGYGGWNNQMGYGKVNAYYALQSTVPVELVSFNASVSGNAVTLSWITSTEINNSGFSVERKSAGNQNYETLGFISGKGTTTETTTYSFTDMNLQNGSYTYRLKQVDFDGSFKYSNEVNVDINTPVYFSLEQNYPNPFNPSTTIKYSIPDDGSVSISVYNMLGEKVATLVNEFHTAGNHEVSFDASQLGSGIYFYTMATTQVGGQAKAFTSTRKMMLVK